MSAETHAIGRTNIGFIFAIVAIATKNARMAWATLRKGDDL